MGILGKLLIVFNLLAAAAFTYFTRENWNLRRQLTYREFENAVRLSGFPVEPRDPAPRGVDKDNVQFVFEVNPSTWVETIEAKQLNTLLPAGGQVYGGGAAVADQTAEVNRLKEKVLTTVPALDPQNPKSRFDWLQT